MDWLWDVIVVYGWRRGALHANLVWYMGGGGLVYPARYADVVQINIVLAPDGTLATATLLEQLDVYVTLIQFI